jgi:hypothetical protein
VTTETHIRKLVEKRFLAAGLSPVSVQVRSFPGETIAIVEIDKEYERALILAEELDKEIHNGFVTVKYVKPKFVKKSTKSVGNVHDERIPKLIELMNARARTSENQPSLSYIQDVGERLSLAISPRHHLIFGRRGVGKTSLLLEAKRMLESDGAYVLWVNMHSLRGLDVKDVFLTVAVRLCDLCIGALTASNAGSKSGKLIISVRDEVDRLLYGVESQKKPALLIPKLQQAVSRFCLEIGQSIFIFLDDVHYLPMGDVPQFLDWLHGITRDNPVWLKVAGIQHQTRWFIPAPPIGLQTGHDAAVINLDITLEHPEKARMFLQSILRSYFEQCDVTPISNVLSASAIDRLVLASGGVPRDFLTLCVGSLQTARQRTNARTVGVQDVNNAAGVAAQTKLQELEDDAAAAIGRSQLLVSVLNLVRDFLISDEQITFLRVDFRDKEKNAAEYRLLQALADLRMLHLINASLSDPHHAGHRSEVYLLDLSQYSGFRLKQKLTVLDFERGHMCLKRTGGSDPVKVGDTALRLVAILRKAPVFGLNQLSAILVNRTDQ